MKVLFLSNSYGGLANFRFELIERFTQMPETTVALAYPQTGAIGSYGEQIGRFSDLPVHVFDTPMEADGTNLLHEYALYKSYRELFARERPDLVLTYTIKPNIYGGLAAHSLNIPYVINVTGLGRLYENGSNVVQKVVNFAYRASSFHAQAVVFQNAGNMEYFLDAIHNHPNVYLVPGSGVDTARFSLMDYPDQGSRTRFLYVGRIMADKGIDELAQAIKKMRQDALDFEVYAVGKCLEEYSDQFQRYVSEGLFIHHGADPEVEKYYRESHAVVIPSHHEGMSNVLLEAAACGRPVIASDIPGCREACLEGESGLLFKMGDAASLENSMRAFMSLPYEKRCLMGISGRDHVLKKFDRKMVTDIYCDIVNQSLERRSV